MIYRGFQIANNQTFLEVKDKIDELTDRIEMNKLVKVNSNMQYIEGISLRRLKILFRTKSPEFIKYIISYLNNILYGNVNIDTIGKRVIYNSDYVFPAILEIWPILLQLQNTTGFEKLLLTIKSKFLEAANLGYTAGHFAFYMVCSELYTMSVYPVITNNKFIECTHPMYNSVRDKVCIRNVEKLLDM